ncbi:hypothetical protein JCM9534A_66920 [Catenuloplanes indicus JCM 9534]
MSIIVMLPAIMPDHGLRGRSAQWSSITIGRCAQAVQVSRYITPVRPTITPEGSCARRIRICPFRLVGGRLLHRDPPSPRGAGQTGELRELRLDVERWRRGRQPYGGTLASTYDIFGPGGASGENERFGARGE